MLIPFLKDAGYIELPLNEEKVGWLRKVVSLMKSRVRNFKQFLEYGDYFFIEDFTVEEKAIEILEQKGVIDILEHLVKRLKEIKDWKEENIESEVREMANQLSLKGKQIIHPTRVSLSGKTIGPGLFSLMEALGKEINIKRLEKTIHKLNKN